MPNEIIPSLKGIYVHQILQCGNGIASFISVVTKIDDYYPNHLKYCQVVFETIRYCKHHHSFIPTIHVKKIGFHGKKSLSTKVVVI